MKRIGPDGKIAVSCGPFVIARLTGLTLEDAERACLRYAPNWARRNADDTVSVQDPAIIATLRDLGFCCRTYAARPATVRRWAEWSRRIADPVVLAIDGHVLLAHDGLIIDNARMRGCPARHHPDRAARVRLAVRVSLVESYLPINRRTAPTVAPMPEQMAA